MTFEVWRRAGAQIRPTRTIGSGLKTPINAGACIEINGVFFVSDEPADPEIAKAKNAALDAIVAGLRATGHQERKK